MRSRSFNYELISLCIYNPLQHEALQLKLTNFHDMPYLRANCMSACRQEHLIKYCNCTVGALFPTSGYPECNVTGLMCLIEFNEIFNAEKPLIKNPFFDEDEQGIVCDCMPDCSRVEYSLSISSISDEVAISEKYVVIDIYYGSSTMIKFRTDVTFSWLDLVVGFGSMFGLFFGCSLLSGAEIFYFSTIALIYQRKRNNDEVSTIFKPKYPFIN
jgi:Amiloride-sensitive sodium channel